MFLERCVKLPSREFAAERWKCAAPERVLGEICQGFSSMEDEKRRHARPGLGVNNRSNPS
jgi:hypothetical protein